MKLYQKIASLLKSIESCRNTGNKEWEANHAATLEDLMEEMPSGSGVDSGTKLLDNSTPDRLVFQADFHHMDENGFYDGWTEHQIIVTPSLAYGFNVRITGRNRNEIKDYLADLFNHIFNMEV